MAAANYQRELDHPPAGVTPEDVILSLCKLWRSSVYDVPVKEDDPRYSYLGLRITEEELVVISPVLEPMDEWAHRHGLTIPARPAPAALTPMALVDYYNKFNPIERKWLRAVPIIRFRVVATPPTASAEWFPEFQKGAMYSFRQLEAACKKTNHSGFVWCWCDDDAGASVTSSITAATEGLTPNQHR